MIEISKKTFYYTVMPLLVIAVLFLFQSPKEVHASKTELPLDELKALSDVYMRIKDNYVQDVDDSELFNNAIKGMLEGLDPHSTYLNEKDFEDLQIGTKGEFGGLGIEITMENGFVKVVSPIDDTPAYNAGVKSGDLIIMLDDKAVKGMSLSEAVDIMRGKVGTSITLTIARQGETEPIKINIVRDTIKIKSVKYEMIDKDYSYIRISSFQSKTGENLKSSIQKLYKNNKELKGIILDLRNNPGGILGAAVDVSDVFLTAGKKIVSTRGRDSDAMHEFSSNNKDLTKNTPLVILINSGSASASEIVAGALQDHKRAIIMGTQSFGKGSVQTILPISQKTALKLTTARYYTPNGRSIQAKGITPDIVVNDLILKKRGEDDLLKEADLVGHLKNTDKKEKSKEKKDQMAKRLENDYQLSEALNLLKGLNIISSK